MSLELDDIERDRIRPGGKAAFDSFRAQFPGDVDNVRWEHLVAEAQDGWRRIAKAVLKAEEAAGTISFKAGH